MAPEKGRHFGREPLDTKQKADIQVSQRSKEELLLLEDHELADQLKHGQHAALAVLMDRYVPVAFHIVRWVLHNYGETEEIVQQIFMEIFRDIGQFDQQKGSFVAWLKLRAYHRALDRRRYLKAQGFYLWEQLDGNKALALSDEARPELSHLVQELLGTLNERERNVVEWIFIEGLTEREIASRTGESLSAIDHRLRRSLTKLRLAYSARGHERSTTVKTKDSPE